jgi:hypothetical protein
MGGIMHVTGEPEGPPTSVGLPICDLGTSERDVRIVSIAHVSPMSLTNVRCSTLQKERIRDGSADRDVDSYR